MTQPRSAKKFKHALCIAAIMAGLYSQQIHAEVQVTALGGDDRWSQRVGQEFTPRSKTAFIAVEKLAKEEYGIDISTRLPQYIAATPKTTLPDNVDKKQLIYLDAGLSEVELRDRGIKTPIRKTLQFMIEELCKENPKNVPEWFATALSEYIGQQIISSLNLPPLPAYANELPLVRSASANAKKSEQQILEQRRARLGEKVRLAMFQMLQQQHQQAFHAKVKSYLLSVSRNGANQDSAFEQAFGSSVDVLLQQINNNLVTTQNKENKTKLVSEFDVSNDTQEVQQAWTTFTAASKPRAIALSLNGGWGVAEKSPRVIDVALDACRERGGTNCRLVALDDEIAIQAGRYYVAVQMGGYTSDILAERVERDWLPVVRQAAAQFDRLVNDTLQVKLSRDAHIFLGAGEEDYQAILINDMKLKPENAELTTEVSGGLSGGNGMIALKFTNKQGRNEQYSLAVKTTLHELTHELQKQMKNSRTGFNAPSWIKEGSADLIAYMLAPQIKINDNEAEPLRNWRLVALNWWRNENRTNLQPEDMVNISHKDWLIMMKEKRGNYQMSDLMCLYLQAITGDKFLPAWVEYFRLSGNPRKSHSGAFEQAFGIPEAEFHADFKRWLVQQ